MRLGAGALGPQMIVRPAAGAFDGEVKGVALTQLAPAAGTAHVVSFFLSHGCGYGLCPVSPPDSVYAPSQGVNAGGYSADRGSCFLSVGPWCGASTPRRWGSCWLPRLCRCYRIAQNGKAVLERALGKYLRTYPKTPVQAASPSGASTAARICDSWMCWYTLRSILGSA